MEGMRFALVDLTLMPKLALAVVVVAFAWFLAAVPDRPFVTFIDLLVLAILIFGVRERWF